MSSARPKTTPVKPDYANTSLKPPNTKTPTSASPSCSPSTKTVDAEGAANLFDSIWIEPVQRAGEAEPCLVVIIRVPGGRENPNLLRPAPA